MTAAFALKASLTDPLPEHLDLSAVKTMYGGKAVANGDAVFIFASESSGGHGLAARGIVAAATATPRRPGTERQTPRVDLTIRLTAMARRPLGRAALKTFSDWDDGRPQTELNFKFYRQATNKLAGLSTGAVQFLDDFF
ncbi:hypothetical protein [Phenylobacterium immobile]|uniref:hypothetical protein n=1 Tax=Phenylobacterium immobile TaxID=21 RepID=UPI000A74BA59|nr:hypothetical protein [Phenylobacterium immobile]